VHVERVANSIKSTGLLQTPIGRIVYPPNLGAAEMTMKAQQPSFQIDHGCTVQLAFGHTRLAAFQLLANDDPNFERMPVSIRTLTDEEMFELSVRENLERLDLTPVEQARAMFTYRDKFGKSSAEIGVLFHLSESAVRNKMRLLNLPEPVQKKLSQGDITEGTARSLLTVQRLAPDSIETLAEKISKNGNGSNPNQVQDSIDQVLRNKEGVILMHAKFSEGEPCGGAGLFPLSYAPAEGLPAKKISELLPNVSKDYVEMALSADPITGIPEDTVNEILALAKPGACTKCPFYAVSAGNHYCGMKPCYQRKKQAWMEEKLHEISEKMGIAILDPKKDGKEVERIGWHNGIYNDGINFQKWVEEKADHLRLMIHFEEYNEHKFTNSRIVELVSINEEYRKKLAKAKKTEAERRTEQQNEEKERELRQKRRDQSRNFIKEIAGAVFGQALVTLPIGVLQALASYTNRINDTTSDPKSYAKVIASSVFYNKFDWEDLSQGPFHMAEMLKPMAADWGISLPADWDQSAKALELE